MANELVVGTRRVGDFIDFDPETPAVKVTLQRSEEGIGVTLSWSDLDNPYAAWFMDDSVRGLRASRAVGKPVPKRVLFHDSHGSVLLVRCWAHGFHSNLVGGAGSGTLWAQAAVLGVQEDIEFDNPDGLQTEISGLRAWLDVSSWRESLDKSEGNLIAALTSVKSPAIELGEYGGVDVTFQPNWKIVPEEGLDRRVVLDMMRCITRTETPTAWAAHLQVHWAIRDLLVLSRWRRESCVELLVQRNDDLLRTMDGKVHGPQWREIVVPEDEQVTPPTGFQQHLIEYSELGPEGLRKWLQLRDQFARALDPILSSIWLEKVTPMTVLAHTGPGLEALGYLLMLRDGTPENAAARATLRARFERILRDLDECLPFEGEAWVTKTVRTYNGLKHANREAPMEVDILNAWRESVMVTRAWVAVELGVPHDQIAERLRNDPQSHAWRPVN